MSVSFAAIFFVGVTTAQTTSSSAQKLVVTSVGSVSTNSTIHRVGGISTTSLEVQLGGQMFPTSRQDPNVSVMVFDAHFIGPESEADALVRKAQTLFDDPDRFVALGEIDTVYRDNLVAFKKQVTHCAISVMRIAAA
jgi:hypothetical protein